MMKELPPQYNPKETEDKIYELWEKSGYFSPDNLPSDTKPYPPSPKPFCIIMPPPNANGALHVGHALFVTLQDIMIRHKRMRGFKTLWLPGADHAGFETQVVYNKKLEREGHSLWGIPHDKLYKEILDFTLKNKSRMESQIRKLGASCDWSREKFTLDEDIKAVVYDTFEMLYKDGLIYRAERPVNWCVKHQTTLSDLEIKYEEREDKLYFVKYEIPEMRSYIEVATTRPETIPADIAIAVNPKSKWKKFIGKTAVNPMTQIDLAIVSDTRVDLSFGTGALKITPHHDALDFEIYETHKKEIVSKPVSVINQFGKLMGAGTLGGLKVKEAREKAALILRPNFAKEPEPYKHQVSVCYKCGTIIEPRVLAQWFIKMTEKPKSGGKSLRDLAVDAVKQKKVKFVTKKFEKIFLHWMKNLRDWNISRQIVWGIPIPAWFHEPKCIPRKGYEKDIVKCREYIISGTKPVCEFCDAQFVQDTDVFDTWFSSGQWPYATLMTTSNKKDFGAFYPTDIMETGWDILFFWVARMIMLGLYRTGKVPFKTIYLHGLVRDKDRQKMSKSKGNVIDPLGVSELYGTDALRMALVAGNAAGNDPVISEEKIKGYRNFANKIWNVSRFVLMKTGDEISKGKISLTAKDKKGLKELANIKKSVTKDIEAYKFHLAAEKLYHYFWHTFADKIIEESKSRLEKGGKEAESATYMLRTILEGSLKMLHPFMPFVTEEIWQKLYGGKKMLMVEKW
ncbi:MAG: valine--tRNA ligase [Candidatus Liptonbacteria bacterium]|nr:valine--tRNA ligase [Candidatus Liptonbacteria bacterium]